MKWTEDQLRAWDKPYKGKLNPRASFYCSTCKKCYGEIDPFENVTEDTIATALILDDNTGEFTDCVHYNDIEIPKQIYETHMRTIAAAGLLSEGHLDNLYD